MKPLKLFKLISEKFFNACGRNDPCWDALGTSGIITLGGKDPETSLYLFS